MTQSIKVFAPATIANLSVGFDVLGLALNSIGDIIELKTNGSAKNCIKEIVDGVNIPRQLEKNCCSVVIECMQKALNNYTGVDIYIQKGFESGSGLGSSSASSAAAAYAFNQLVGEPFSKHALIAFAAEGERIACGTAHADNVAPALCGGLVLLQMRTPIHCIQLPIPKSLHVVVLFPRVEVSTAQSRGVLPSSISIEKAVAQWSNLGSFIASLYQGDFDLMEQSLHDKVAEPYRAQFIPYFDELKQQAMQANAIGFGISGSGPSVFALARNQEDAHKIQYSMQSVFNNSSIDYLCFVENLHQKTGCRIIQ